MRYPIDPFYLTWKAGEINTAMPDYVVSQVVKALNQQHRSLSQSKVLVLGASYKKNVDDMRESPSVVLIAKLQALGAEVAYSDPYVPGLPKMRAHDLGLQSVPVDAESIARYDCVLAPAP